LMPCAKIRARLNQFLTLAVYRSPCTSVDH
jgi:hypothetical protein